MDNKLLGVIIIGFGLLVLFSEQEYSWIISALAVGIGSGFVIRKTDNKNTEK
tara:strand:+ start:79 stop:234 length:156 start_codon:yes stop_codon:yes gene_type:complete